jgi:hypothetical protein
MVGKICEREKITLLKFETEICFSKINRLNICETNSYLADLFFTRDDENY